MNEFMNQLSTPAGWDEFKRDARINAFTGVDHKCIKTQTVRILSLYEKNNSETLKELLQKNLIEIREILLKVVLRDICYEEGREREAQLDEIKRDVSVWIYSSKLKRCIIDDSDEIIHSEFDKPTQLDEK